MASSAQSLSVAPKALDRGAIGKQFIHVRQRSLDLLAPLSAEDACVQSMPDASPAKWHLAHVTWFFETFILERYEATFSPHHEAFRELYNSYYNGIGKQFSRPHRGLITRPSLQEVIDYRAGVDQRMLALIEHGDNELLTLVELGLHHEQQHQELLLMDIKHLLSLNPLCPAYNNGTPPASAATTAKWLAQAGGLLELGHQGDGFHYDNETPAHKVWLEPFKLNSQLVSNRDFLEFIDDGGYRTPLLWLADGWAEVNQQGWTSPNYWRHRDGRWCEFSLYGEHPLDLDQPVCHISYYEADAFAQWAGARLASEFEWEAALATTAPRAAPETELHPRTVASNGGFSNAFDAVWQWTRSAYLPYPGFAPAAGAVGEYNGKFMSNQMTLRGGACITEPGHSRASYRNFFYPHQRWAFCGMRLAKDA